MRVNPNGSLDTTFNGTGKVTTAFGCQEFTSGVAIQSDGKIVVAGSTDNVLYDFYDFVVVRYQGDDAPAAPIPSTAPTSSSASTTSTSLTAHPIPLVLPIGRRSLITVLVADPACDRIHVSSSFFRSPEFQGRGYFVYRFYPVAFGRKPDYDEFTPDLAKVSGFLTDAELEAAKLAFIFRVHESSCVYGEV